jgi:hypothetical protein
MGHQNSVFSPTPIPFYTGTRLSNVLTATNYHIAFALRKYKTHKRIKGVLQTIKRAAENGSAYGSGLQFYGQFAVGYTSNNAIKTPIRCPALNSSLSIVLPGTSCNANMSILLSNEIS